MMFATVILSLVIVAIVALIIRKMVRDKRAGVSSCGGKCGDCGLCAGGSCSGAHKIKN